MLPKVEPSTTSLEFPFMKSKVNFLFFSFEWRVFDISHQKESLQDHLVLKPKFYMQIKPGLLSLFHFRPNDIVIFNEFIEKSWIEESKTWLCIKFVFTRKYFWIVEHVKWIFFIKPWNKFQRSNGTSAFLTKPWII